jgi:YesN/AraC family two-component response regulator
MFAIQNMVEELVPAERRLPLLTMDRSIYLFIGNRLDGSKPFKVEMFTTAELIQQKVKSYLQLKVSIGVSRAFKQLLDAPFAGQESMDALTYRIRLGHEAILFIEDVTPGQEAPFHYPRELEFRLLDAVRQLDHEHAMRFLKEMVSTLSKFQHNHHNFLTFWGRLSYSLVGVVQDAGGTVQEVFPKDVLQAERWMAIHSAEEMFSWFEKQMLLPLLSWLQTQKTKREINISEEIIKKIQLDYDKDLSIELFAASMNFHPDYIGRVFKRETGMTFTDYLSQHRIELAKQWLRVTDMKSSEIAEKLGYSTASNFNRLFKKFEQITPTEYREQHRGRG